MCLSPGARSDFGGLRVVAVCVGTSAFVSTVHRQGGIVVNRGQYQAPIYNPEKILRVPGTGRQISPTFLLWFPLVIGLCEIAMR